MNQKSLFILVCVRARVCVQCYLHREIVLKNGTIFGLAGFIFMSLPPLPLFLKILSAKKFLLQSGR